MRVVHVVSSNFLDPQFKYLGSTKDILGRYEYFAARGIECEQIVLRSRSDELCGQALSKFDFSRFTALFIEHPRYPKTLTEVRRRWPKLRILIRGHNAEFIHHWHAAAAYWTSGFGSGGWRAKKAGQSAKTAFQRFRDDRRCAAAADAVMAISDWDARHYWPWMAPRREIIVVPYFLPEAYVDGASEHAAPKADSCVCMLSADWNPMVHDAGRTFSRIVPDPKTVGWDFVVIGQTRKLHSFANLSRLQIRGLLDNPLEELRRARAMALLSNYGTGFKTKIVDAIQCGCFILMPKRLFDRQPPEVKPWCLSVDPLTEAAFTSALSQIPRSPPFGEPNSELRARAFAALDHLLS